MASSILCLFYVGSYKTDGYALTKGSYGDSKGPRQPAGVEPAHFLSVVTRPGGALPDCGLYPVRSTEGSQVAPPGIEPGRPLGQPYEASKGGGARTHKRRVLSSPGLPIPVTPLCCSLQQAYKPYRNFFHGQQAQQFQAPL